MQHATTLDSQSFGSRSDDLSITSCCLFHFKIVFKGARWDRKAEIEKRFFKAIIIFHCCRVIDDQTYVGIVKEKKVATQQYLAAVSQVLYLTFVCKACIDLDIAFLRRNGSN